MPKEKQPRSPDQRAAIERLKAEYRTYCEMLRINRLAAYRIGRDEDTVLTWRKESPDFAGFRWVVR
jgi:hypothetical protein